MNADTDEASDSERFAEHAYGRLLDDLADAVVIADPRGVVIFWNRAAEKLFGWPAKEAIGATLDLIIPERLRQRHWDGYARALQSGTSRYGDQLLEVPAMHRDGHRISIAFTVTFVREGVDQPPVAIAAVIRDESARWQERRELLQRIAALEGT